MEIFHTTWTWVGFSIFLAVALLIDTFVIGKYRSRNNETWRAALFWTIIWIACALVFNLALWLYMLFKTDAATANDVGLTFLTAYLVEKSLSMDNLFVFYLIFQHFKIDVHAQHRVLTYGIWGAVIMRLLIIVVGIWLISRFHWLLYVMGAILVFTGIKILLMKEKEQDISEAFIIRLTKRFFRVTSEFSGDHFFIRKNKLLYATPMFVALVFVEFSDLVFAIDSIPAVFAITREPFIVWTSNVFAILGLRALYFLLARMVEDLEFLKYGIALILVFVGVKMLIEPWIDVPAIVSLSVILFLITAFSLVSVKLAKRHG